MVARLYTYCLRTSLPAFPLRHGMLLEYNKGWGEIAPLPGFSQETFEEAKEEILSLLPNYDFLTKQIRCASVRVGVASARSPLSRAPLSVPLCLLNRSDPKFPTTKLKIGHLSSREAISKVTPLIKSCRLRLDCNRLWNLEKALDFARNFSPEDFEYLEEPVQTFEELIAFSKQTGFPVAVDESIGQSLEKIPTLRAIIVKPTVTGEIAPPIHPSIRTVLSSAHESSLGLLQIARHAANLSSTSPLGLDTAQYLLDDILIPPLLVENGFLQWNPTLNLDPIDRSKLCLIASVP